MTGINSQINENELKRYLFGEISEDERAQMEENILLDDELYFRIIDLEDEMVDMYVTGKLIEAEGLSRFENSLEEMPERRAKIANAIALQSFIAKERIEDFPIIEEQLTFWEKLERFLTFKTLAFGSAFAALFVVLLIIPFIFIQFTLKNSEISQVGNTSSSFPTNNRVNYNSANTSSPSNSQIPQPTLSNTATPRPSSRILSAELLPDTLDSSPLTITIDRITEQLSLKLILPNSTPQNEHFSVKLNGKIVAGYLAGQVEDNKRNIKLTIWVMDFVKGINELKVTDEAGNKVSQYNFYIQRR